MEKELKTVPLEVAVEKFLQDLKVNNRADGALSLQALFGKKIIERFGADTPVLDITPTDLHDWRQTWTFGDSTAAVFVSSVKQFFKFCEVQTWLPASPAKHLKRPEIEQGSSRVVALLNKLPERQPFRRRDLKLESDKGFWRIQLQDLFERAKITEVKTDLEMRPAHPLRDTCAVWYIPSRARWIS
jgi:hypothetical protein